MFDRSYSCCYMLAVKTLPVDLLNFPAMEILDAIFIEVDKFVTVFFCSKIAVIRKLQEELTERKNEIEEDIRLAESEGKCPNTRVRVWLRKVEETAREVQPMVEEAVERMQGPCLFGQKAAEEILERLEGYLNDGGIKRVAVWGRGGVGKTTLVRNLEQLETSSLMESLNIVIGVRVSKDLDLRDIQSQIAKRLRLEFDAEETIDRRARRLHERLMTKKRFLLILDNVWEKLKLIWTLWAFHKMKTKLTILRTTRSLDVGRNMITDQEVKMNLLNEEATWNLFAEYAGNVVRSEKINPIAKAIARKCCGLPLAIATVGKSMSNKRMKE
ncbi:hypothetical protein CUMW_139720 [Citrus unshiu]|nr:hypothetical protein CUMW_139720 [Citrus unshiu]